MFVNKRIVISRLRVDREYMTVVEEIKTHFYDKLQKEIEKTDNVFWDYIEKNSLIKTAYISQHMIR